MGNDSHTSHEHWSPTNKTDFKLYKYNYLSYSCMIYHKRQFLKYNQLCTLIPQINFFIKFLLLYSNVERPCVFGNFSICMHAYVIEAY